MTALHNSWRGDSNNWDWNRSGRIGKVFCQGFEPETSTTDVALKNSPPNHDPGKPLRVLIVPDKFKGTLTAEEAALAMRAGWVQIRKRDRVSLLPMSDGGDGFGPVVGAALGGNRRLVRTMDAAGRPVVSHGWWHAPSKTAEIESARTIGLAQLPKGRFHPFKLDTFGLGAMVRAAEHSGARSCLIGIGGSATNDGGFGLARSLGWRFLDAAGREILRWPDLLRLSKVEPAPISSPISDRIVAVDVNNPLTGPRGCSRIYGPQKGLRPQDMEASDAALKRMAMVLQRQGLAPGCQFAGAGAAGGLGYGLHIFWGARIESGFDVFAKSSKLRKMLDQADLVITGEGSIDASSLMGKGVGEIVALCQKRKIPCLGLGGVVSAEPKVRRVFAGLHGMGTHLTRASEARKDPKYWLRKLGSLAAREFSLPGTA